MKSWGEDAPSALSMSAVAQEGIMYREQESEREIYIA